MTGAWPQVSYADGLFPCPHADDLADAARGALASAGQAVMIREACEAAMIKILNRPLTVGRRRHTAMLVPASDGFRAVVDSVIWERAKRDAIGRRRLRFVLAHELGHTFFYRPGRPPRRTRPPDRLEERFCNRFATSLLVPRTAAEHAAADPEGLFGLASHYDVSLQVAAGAVAHARPVISVLWLTKAPHPVRGGFETMRVEWGASKRFIARGESFKSGLADLLPGENAASREKLLLAGREELVDIRAWRFSTSMLAVVEPTNSTDSGHEGVESG